MLGVGVGFAMARWRFPGRDLADALLTLPMVMPPTVLGYYLLVVIGTQGAIGAWLLEHFGIRLIFTWQAAVIAATDRVLSAGLQGGARGVRAGRPATRGRRPNCWASANSRCSSASRCRWPGAASWPGCCWPSRARWASSAPR
jgi:hypothetical protein